MKTANIAVFDLDGVSRLIGKSIRYSDWFTFCRLFIAGRNIYSDKICRNIDKGRCVLVA